MSLGLAIKQTRQKTLLTQEEFAKELRVATSTVNHWELEKACPSFSTMKKIKIFCESNNISFDNIEFEWLKLAEKEDAKCYQM